jgi:hypothetical protein
MRGIVSPKHWYRSRSNFDVKRGWEAAKNDSDESAKTDEHKMWILISGYPELAEGTTETCVSNLDAEIIGVVTNISRLEFAERVQRQHTEEASAHANGLETFINTTSHEVSTRS